MPAHHFTVVTAAAFLLTAMAAQAQSLADVARKEEERRKATPEAAKVYTNKDLNAAPAPSTPAGGTKDTKGGLGGPSVSGHTEEEKRPLCP